MSNPALERFMQDLDDLVDRWRDEPSDDILLTAEMAGALEVKKFQLLRDSFDRQPRVRLLGPVD